jgi:hypothetical protein
MNKIIDSSKKAPRLNLFTKDIERIFGAKSVANTKGMNTLELLELIKKKLESK